MTVIICPGIHSAKLTEGFLSGLSGRLTDCLVFPGETEPPFSPVHVLHFLHRQFTIPQPSPSLYGSLGDRRPAVVAEEPLLFISFSAGVVGAIGAAWIWQQMGRTVKAFIALDGWGVPLYGNFPIYRLSHDRFTYWSSALLGAGQASFYADPPVPHLELWRSPQTAAGWHVLPANIPWHSRAAHPTNAADFLVMLLAAYGEIGDETSPNL